MSATLDTVRDAGAGEFYPRSRLEGLSDALVLFASGFLGRQDAYWIAEAGMAATCVDVDGQRLGQMESLYPAGWEFVQADVFDFAARAERTWDVVSVDCPTNLFGRCAELVGLWCLLAGRVVVLGTGVDTQVIAPEGWEIADVRRRSDFRGGVFWTVLERC